MSSQPASQPDSIDLAYDMWAGQFEFVGPTAASSTPATTANNNNCKLKQQQQYALNNTLQFGDRNASHRQSNESLEDLNLNFGQTTPYSLGCGYYDTTTTTTANGDYYSKQPVLIDQETFLSLNPTDFDDIVPSGPNSLIFIDNKLADNTTTALSTTSTTTTPITPITSECNNNNKILNYESLSHKCNNKTNNTNTNGFKLENLKNFKNKLICDYEDKTSVVLGENNNNNNNNNNLNNNKMNGISLEMCENLNEQVSIEQQKIFIFICNVLASNSAKNILIQLWN